MDSMEDTINKTIESLDGIHRAAGNPFLYEKVMQRINNNLLNTAPANNRIIWRFAALLALLISFNIMSLIYLNNFSNNCQADVASMAHEYFSYMDSIKF